MIRPTIVAACLLALLPRPASSHDIPNDVIVRLYLHPEGNHLRLLVRAPLEAMRDIEWPTRGPGYLELDEARALLEDAARLWIVNEMEVYEESSRLQPTIIGTRISVPSDPAFTTYETAVAHFQSAPLAPDTDLYWQQALIDVMVEYPVGSDQDAFSIRPGLERLGLSVLTLIRFVSADGVERVFEFGDDPGRVRLDPRWHQAALTFVRSGFHHILGGTDHLLFLLCLVIPLRRLRPLVTVVTAFTLAHSITLVASAYNLSPNALWFPPLIETLIAASIVYMAIGNIIRPDVTHRWVIAFGFGLVHGFGFSFALADTMQLAGDHLLTALLSFNLGVELGQLLILVLMIPLIQLFLKTARSDAVGTTVLSVLVGHTAWHWMLDRGGTLGEFSWPGLAVPPLTLALRWLMLIVIIVGAAWMFSLLAGPTGSRRERAAADSRP